jgi:ribosomal protein L12E/L44/L45/RPP1/RPP2
MAEPKTPSDVRTLAVRVSPDFHAQLSMVAQVDGVSLTDLMMTALQNHVAARRGAEDFQAKAQAALAEEEARMARTRAMLLGTAPAEAALLW